MTNEGYVKKYIELYAKLCKTPDDYADKSKAKGEGDQASRKIDLRVRLMLAPEAEFETLQGQSQ